MLRDEDVGLTTGRTAFPADLAPARIVARSPGGGGWGDSAACDRELVRRHVRDGVVSPEAARDVYGLED